MENCLAEQQIIYVNEQMEVIFHFDKRYRRENYVHFMQCKATTYVIITGIIQSFHLKSCSFFAIFVRGSLRYKSKPCIH